MPSPRSQSSAQTSTIFSPNFRVVGFYTKDTPYAEEILGLERSCEVFKIPCYTISYPNRKKWERNAGIKPEFLLKCLELDEQRMVYLDADARIKRQPVLFNELDCDLAVHYRHGRELLSGTIFFKNNASVRTLFEQWAAEQQAHPDEWDQRVLARVIKQWSGTVGELPAAYCQIFDTMKSAGDPVVEHMQASRRYKKLVEVSTCPLPTAIHGIKIRRSGADGSIWIARAHKAAEAWLDEHCLRLGNQLRWLPKCLSDRRIADLSPIFTGQSCYIVGKGPSLDHLRAEHFETGCPIIALNEAIHAVESLGLSNPIYGLQQDAKLRATCMPKKAPILVDIKAANYYAHYEDAYIFANVEFNLHPSALSVSAAIRIAQSLGAQSFKLICFDACVNKQTHYAKRIGYESTWGGKPERFLTHRAKILAHAKGMPLEWIIPTSLAEASVDTPQQ